MPKMPARNELLCHYYCVAVDGDNDDIIMIISETLLISDHFSVV